MNRTSRWAEHLVAKSRGRAGSVGWAALWIALCAGCAGQTPPAGAKTQEPTAASLQAELGDWVAIRALLERATDAIQHHEWQLLASLFAEDAIWEALPPIGWQLRGREQILVFLTGNQSRVEVLSYSVGATAIEVQGPRRATARSTMHELLRLKEGETGLHLVGTYTDEFAKTNGEWRFTRRSFQLRYEDDVELPERLSPKTSRAGALGTGRGTAVEDRR